jgi:alpha-glucosidase
MREGTPRARSWPGRGHGWTRRGVLRLSAGAAFAATGAGPRTSLAPSAPPGTYGVGSFRLTLSRASSGEPMLRIVHAAEPNRALWESLPTGGFLAAGVGRASIAENTTPASGFAVRDTVLVRYDRQTLTSVTASDRAITFIGTLTGDHGGVDYAMTWTAPLDSHLRFEVKLSGPAAAACNRLRLRCAAAPDEHFFGFGQQLTYFDQTGRVLPILVQEHGVGRGLPVITQLVALRYGSRSAGSWYTTEVSVPHYLTNRRRSLFLETTEYCQFDLSRPGRVELELFAPTIAGRILYGRTPLDLIESYTDYAGRMRPLPDWVHDGVLVAVQGGTARARQKLAELVRAGVPVAAFWIQDWVGQRQTPAGSQLWWDWRLDTARYPDWDGLRAELQAHGARVLIYINPFLANQAGHDQLYAEAVRAGYLVKTAAGTPYLIPNAGFSAGLLDLSNEQARSWIKGLIKERMLGQAGASGWMADFGEALPFDAVLASGEPAATWHNRYPEEWARVNREAIEEAGHGTDAVFFCRSGYTQSPGIATLFWLGDQLQSWDGFDGLKTAIVGALAGGVSGFSLVHSDTGGFDSIEVPLPGGRSLPIIHRSKELLLRWMELSAFTPVFRTHEGIAPEVAWQVDGDAATLAHFKRCAELYRAWGFYRRAMVAEAASTGHPVMRHLVLHYPDDPQVLGLRYQYLLGPDLLVAPVVEPDATAVRLYLPAGEWRHVWSGAAVGRAGGTWHTAQAPLGQPALFLRRGSPNETALLQALTAVGRSTPA